MIIDLCETCQGLRGTNGEHVCDYRSRLSASLAASHSEAERLRAELAQANEWLEVHRKVEGETALALKKAEAERDEAQRMLTEDRAATKAAHDERCQGQTEPFNTRDYRLAPDGEGPHAGTWFDKPHRLIYDLCSHIESFDKPHRLIYDLCSYIESMHPAPVAPVPVTSEPVAWRSDVHKGFVTQRIGIVQQWRANGVPHTPLYLRAAPAPAEAGRERVTTKERWQLRRGSDDALLFSSPSKARALNKRQEMHMKGSKMVHIVRYRLVK